MSDKYGIYIKNHGIKRRILCKTLQIQCLCPILRVLMRNLGTFTVYRGGFGERTSLLHILNIGFS